MNDANKETNAAYEEPKKKVYVKLLVFLVLITAIVVVLGAKFRVVLLQNSRHWRTLFL